MNTKQGNKPAIAVWDRDRLVGASELHRSVMVVAPSWAGWLTGGATGFSVRLDRVEPDGSMVVISCSPTTGRIRRGDHKFVVLPSDVRLYPGGSSW